ncbi:hypothetical protein J5N97_029979 [Dioscorea zingiberensis]|uniref:Uncharacterized protein n=1 Tax=Dioscorea zingiberensis TaxID=325984 RepID=A0A9D5BWP5_9LILI|nr:hypothetical protein J5N97_029979 [Dioscorea zingiberensis]
MSKTSNKTIKIHYEVGSRRLVLRAACLGWRVASVSGRFLLNKTINVFICVDRFDVYRQDNLDRQVIKAISDSFG